MIMGQFKLADNGVIVEMLNMEEKHLLVCVANEKDGVIKRLHKMDCKNLENGSMDIKGRPYYSRTADSALFERIVFQWEDPLGAVLGQRRENVRAKLIDLCIKLSKAEEEVLQYFDLMSKAANNNAAQGGVQRQKSGITYTDPTMELKKIAEGVIIGLVIALRKLPLIVELISGKKFPKKGEKFLPALIDLLPEGHPDRTNLAKDRQWLKSLWDIRGKIEHATWEVKDFSVIPSVATESGFVSSDCEIEIEGEKESPIFLSNYLEVTFQNVAGFVEDAVLLAVRYSLPNYLTMGKYSEETKNHHRYFVAWAKGFGPAKK
jgi:hypothetical protein